jgi:hypothetical protein
MNPIKSIFYTVILSVLVAAAGPVHAALSPDDKATIEDVKKETRDLIDSVKSYSAEQRDEAIQKIELAILRLDNRIEGLQARIDDEWDDMTVQTRQQTRASLRALQKERVKLAEWYGNLKGSSADAWDEIKRGFSQAYSSINKAWAKALNEFGDSKN